jgi:hypothetical protein
MSLRFTRHCGRILAALALGFLVVTPAGAQVTRARALGIPFDGEPGQLNAITDVSGVEVGYATLIRGEPPLQVGVGRVRTGVTAILPRGSRSAPCTPGGTR